MLKYSLHTHTHTHTHTHRCQLGTHTLTLTHVLFPSLRFNLILLSQLLGMTDNISFVLAKHDYKVTLSFLSYDSFSSGVSQVYKYVPYGRVKLVIPYLVRRAQENSGMMTTGAAEKKLLSLELRRRVKSFLSFKK